jgi:hypothetical protein
MCGIATSDHADAAVMAVAAWLQARIASLGSEELRMCCSIAFGLRQESRAPSLLPRLTVVAEKLGHTVQTARRRVEAAIVLIARSTTPNHAVPYQLRQHADGWVELSFVSYNGRNDRDTDKRSDTGSDSGDDGCDDGETVQSVRCFLIAVTRPMDQPDRDYALVRRPDTAVDTPIGAATGTAAGAAVGAAVGAVAAIPVVWVRQVRSAPPSDADTLAPNHER